MLNYAGLKSFQGIEELVGYGRWVAASDFEGHIRGE
jgi:hypothetical protein